MSVELTAEDRAMLEGDRDEAPAMAMRIIAAMADVSMKTLASAPTMEKAVGCDMLIVDLD